MKIVKFKVKKPREKPSDKIILSNRLYVPAHLVTKEIASKFTATVGNSCGNCDLCEPHSCPQGNFMAVELFKEFKDGDYIGFHRGNLKKLKKYFDWNLVEDKRSRKKMKHKINFIGTLRPNQKDTVKQWFDHNKEYPMGGSIKSPPRSGKTVMAADIICKVGLKTLILVNQDELADQFYKTFMNLNEDKDGNKIEFTDAPYLEKKHKKQIVGIAKRFDDFYKDWSVTISTYQKFLKKIKKLKKLRNQWGFVFVDEYHMASADGFAKVTGTTNPLYRIGCSATPKRKDQLHVIGQAILGKPVAKGTAEQLPCDARFISTEHKVQSFFQWNTFISRLVNDKNRNELIVREIIKDVKAGDKVLATTTRVEHSRVVAEMLRKKGIKALQVSGATKGRKDILERFKKGKIQVLVASRQITKVGLDLPILSSMHLLVPGMDPYQLVQEVARCRTPYPGKIKGKIRVYIDKDHNVCYAVKNKYLNVFKQEKFDIYFDTNVERAKCDVTWGKGTKKFQKKNKDVPVLFGTGKGWH